MAGRIVRVNHPFVNNDFLMWAWGHVWQVTGDFLSSLFMRDVYHLIICADSSSSLKGVVVSELFCMCTARALTWHRWCIVSDRWPPAFFRYSYCMQPWCWTFFMTCPVCEERVGWAGRGKEIQHSFEELCFLDWNNHCRGKTRLKIASGWLDCVEGYKSSARCCFMHILGQTACSLRPRRSCSCKMRKWLQ